MDKVRNNSKTEDRTDPLGPATRGMEVFAVVVFFGSLMFWTALRRVDQTSTDAD